MSSRDDFIMLVESIYGDAPEGVVWVCSNDRNSRPKAKWRQKPFVYPSALGDAWGWLNEEASSGRDVYFAAHAMLPGRRRTKLYALPVSTLWADGDGALVPDHLPQPSIVIESSPGRHWYFWCLDRPIDPAKAEELGRRIAATIGADPSGADVTQVARVPGTRNYKYPDAPEVVLLELQADRVYSPAEIESAFNQLPEQRRHVPHDPNPVVDTSTAPPVSLSENDLAVWTGAAFVTKPDGSVDRSRSLCAIARILRDAGADAGDVLSAIRERDKALGWHKYTSRSDGVERYNEIVGLVARHEDRLWDRGCALIATLRSAEDGGALIQQIVDDPEEAAALRLIADRNPSLWTGCLYALEERREKGARIRALKAAVKHAPAATSPAMASKALPVSSVLGSASPAPDGMVVPAGWTLSDTGIGELGSPRALTVSPILLTGRWVEEGGTEHIEVAWLRDGRWVRERVARGVIADRRQLVALADRGFPVTTENSGALVRYLHDLEEANLERIPKAKGVSRLGWADAQCNTFLLGSESISLEPDPLVLIPPSAGAGQIAQALGVAGDLDKWKEAVSPMLPHPLVVAALGSSAAAPLLPILGVQNFIVDFVNQTSSGKTTLLKVAASVFGNPSTGDSAPLIASWNTTEVGFEQRASMLNGLPLFLDDSKQATVGKELSRLIYHFANGKGRNRGGIDGVANLRTWSSVLISTGESPLIAESNDGGTRVRVVTLWARPFGDLDAETGTRVRNLNRLVDRCYGLAGRAYLWHLLAAGNGELQAEFGRLESQYSQYAGENVLAQRLAPVVAVMHLGAQLLLESLDIDCDVHAAFGEIWGLVAAESKEADRADAAIEYVADWLTAHPNRMWQTEHHEESPPGGWAGTRDELGRHCFIPAVLKQILSEGSFDAEGILRTWTDRGLLSKAPSGGNPQKRFANVRSRLLTFSPDAFDVKDHTEEDGTARTTGSGRPKPSSPHRPARRPE